MKHLKILGAALVAAIAVTALLGSGTASATVLCKEAKNPCGTSAYPSGTEFKTELFTGGRTVWRNPDSSTYDECTGNTLLGKIGSAGGVGTAVTVPLSSASWTGCVRSRTILKSGTLEINYASGLTYAPVKWKELEWSDNEIFHTCTFSSGAAGLEAGRLESSFNSTSAAVLLMKIKVPRVAGEGCPEWRVIEAQIHVATPVPLYVEPS